MLSGGGYPASYYDAMTVLNEASSQSEANDSSGYDDYDSFYDSYYEDYTSYYDDSGYDDSGSGEDPDGTGSESWDGDWDQQSQDRTPEDDPFALIVGQAAASANLVYQELMEGPNEQYISGMSGAAANFETQMPLLHDEYNGQAQQRARDLQTDLAQIETDYLDERDRIAAAYQSAVTAANADRDASLVQIARDYNDDVRDAVAAHNATIESLQTTAC